MGKIVVRFIDGDKIESKMSDIKEFSSFILKNCWNGNEFMVIDDSTVIRKDQVKKITYFPDPGAPELDGLND